MTADDVDVSELPHEVQERLPIAVERAHRKARTVQPNRDAEQLVRAAQKASTASQRVLWLQRAASAWAKPIEKVAACRKGCAHCCHISVTISAVEAAAIGRHVGVKPAQPDKAVHLQCLLQDMQQAISEVQTISARTEPSPCPFLVDDACSIYEARPMACRLLLNLDDDELLCKLITGQAVPVPYANSDQLKTLYLMAQVASPLADIREFFPTAPPSTTRQ
ncbi:YkgJ family cysteine cluster protein [Pseudorhodoferax soli]|uniref:Putative zinc-or iron-chelating protein n=1 Tax=Pseudorhodoferax soli TaxID=545864 RepID=A0A368XEI1_9BURK|nr:YkgJ family cysteine cluster protein [Pseudorhodoferax soli]RCW66265.1 putative zinc- or iron-chelating protein [Pseudorhodoferax soli]